MFLPTGVVLAAVSFLSLANQSIAGGVPVNLLPLGDSITWQGAYIEPLEAKLSERGYDPSLLGVEGHPGFLINGMLTGATREGLREHIGPSPVDGPDFLAHAGVNAPNTFILLLVGTNDVATGFDQQTAQVQARMTDLITAIHDEAPLAHLVVANLPPIVGAGKRYDVAEFNKAMLDLPEDPTTSYVDMHSAFEQYPGFQQSPQELMADHLHPNRQGGEVMAEVWADSINFPAAHAVPEPGTAGFLGVALAGLVLRRGRRGR